MSGGGSTQQQQGMGGQMPMGQGGQPSMGQSGQIPNPFERSVFSQFAPPEIKQQQQTLAEARYYGLVPPVSGMPQDINQTGQYGGSYDVQPPAFDINALSRTLELLKGLESGQQASPSMSGEQLLARAVGGVR